MLDVAWRIVEIIFPVFACAGVGLIYARYHRPDMRVINKLNMDLFVPILIFWALLDKPFDIAGHLPLMVGGIVVILGSGILLYPLVRLFRINLKTFLPPMMFNNSANMGIPLIVFTFGDDLLQAAVILFVIEMLAHFTLGIYILDRHTRFFRLLRMPMIIATVLGVIASAAEVRLPVAVLGTLELLGQVAIPLLLFSLGVRLLDVELADWKLGVFGAIAGPVVGLCGAALVLPWLQLDNTQTAVLLLFAALPPAVMNVLVAEQYNQQPQRVASIVLLGNLGSLVLIPAVLWYVLTAM